jgi:lipoprotein signal peptidase
MSRRTWSMAMLAGTAVPFAAADLLVKAAVPTPSYAFHSRPLWQLGIGLVLALSLATIVVVVGSRAIAGAAGVAIGGTIGNLASVAIWGAAPNPFVLVFDGSGVAFNLADVLVVAGAWLIAVTAAVHARAQSGRLRTPVSQL